MTTLRVKLTNTASSGTCSWHQAEVYANLFSNPSMETGTGDADDGDPTPWVPTDWTNNAFEVGESQRGDISHSGNYSLRVNTTSTADNDAIQKLFSPGAGTFYSGGVWIYGDNSVGLDFGAYTNEHAAFQSSSSNYYVTSTASSWNKKMGVWRNAVGTPVYVIRSKSGAIGPRYADDPYLFSLTPITLTATPASQANSTETTGLRVDGADTLTQSITNWTATEGVVKFKYTPRRNFAISEKFGGTNYILTLWGGGSNFIRMSSDVGSNRLVIDYVMNGSAFTTYWTNPGFVAGTTYSIELAYKSNGVFSVRSNGVLVSSTPLGNYTFSVVPTTAYFCSYSSGAGQCDTTITSFVTASSAENTTAPYYKFGSKSVKLIGYDREDQYTTPVTLPSNAAYTISSYVYDGTTGNVGGTVGSTVASLASSSASLSTTYTDMGGGWWRLSYTTPTIPAGSSPYNFGVQVHPGKTIYIDGVQVEAKSYPTTYTDGTLGTGYAWTGTAHQSTSTRTAGATTYASSLASLSSQSVYTVSQWLYTPGSWDARSGDRRYLFTGGPVMWIENGLKSIYVYSSYAGGQMVVYPYTFSGKGWHHFVIKQDTLQQELFIDGVSYGVKTLSVSEPSFTYFSFGGYPTGAGDFLVSDARVYNGLLTTTEVQGLYSQGLITHTSSSESDDRYTAGSSTYTSPVMDLSANGAWGATPLTMSNSIPVGGAAISYSTRTSTDNVTWSDWAAVVGNDIASDPRRYFQWKADLSATTDLTTSPVIDGMTLTYVQDSTVPTNPDVTALGFSTAATPSADLTSGSWYNYSTPKFTWEAGVDSAVGGQSASGIDGYHVLLTTDQTATPSSQTGDLCYLWAEEGSRVYTVGTTPSTCTLSDETYYLRLQTKDNSGNNADPVTLFTYSFDATIPNAPANVSTSNVGYQSTNSFTFYWPTATDNGPAGILGYEYKTGTTSGIYADWQFTSGVQVDSIPAYTQGQNFFYVRSKDGAGNVSGTQSNNVALSSFYYNSTAPTAPLNVTITPTTTVDTPASSNVFSVAWDKPASYSGEIAKYYYCVNCTPSSSTMTETTPAETATRTLTSLSLATQQGKNTFSIVAEDNNVNSNEGHGNRNFEAYTSVDFYASTTAPGAPTNLTVTDASDRDSSKWRLTLIWDEPTSGGDVTIYNVYRSTDGATYTKVGETTATAYTDASLTQSQEYSYKIYAFDSAGSSSIASNVVTSAPEGKYSSAPTITGSPTATVGATSATITWSTSRSTYGSVEYGKTSSYGAGASEASPSSSHTIKITGLSPGDTYHYKTLALDASELVGYERGDSYSGDYTFTTLSTPTISSVTVSDLTLNSAVISWQTASLATAQIEYGETTGYGTKLDVSAGATESTHSARLSNLTHTKTYHFRVRGVSVDGTDIFSEDNMFSTLIFPKITTVVMNTDQTSSGMSVTLGWRTNVPTTSEVTVQRVEIEPAYAQDSEQNLTNPQILQSLSQEELAKLPVQPVGEPQTFYLGQLTPIHLQKITQLSDGSIYVFTIRGKDAHGTEVISDPIRYATGADTKPPTMENIIIETPVSGVGSEAKAQIIVSWDTDEPSTGQVLFGPGVGSEYPQATETSKDYTNKHILVIRDLDPTSTYHLQLETKSQDTVVVTPTSQQAALDIILQNLSDVFGFLKL
jgi:hypothetical protein